MFGELVFSDSFTPSFVQHKRQRSARMGFSKKSLYASFIPSSNSVLYFQPNASALLTSNSLRGVPFGLVVSHSILPS